MSAIIGLCADPDRFVRKVNRELDAIWKASTAFHPDLDKQLAAIGRKIDNLRQALEDGLNDAAWANARLKDLLTQREALRATSRTAGKPRQIDVETVMKYRKDAQKLLEKAPMAERKQFLRTVVQEVKLIPEELMVEIAYRVPQAVMNGLATGGGFEPPTFGL